MTAQSEMLSANEVWEDFYSWVNTPENWRPVTPSGRDQIAKAQKAYLNPDEVLGINRICNLVSLYAPGRYRVAFIRIT